jgi:hypothetical protein
MAITPTVHDQPIVVMIKARSIRDMRLSMAVNGGNPIVASLPHPGYLSAHLNMSDRPKENERKKTIGLGGHETRETETVHLKWPSVELKVGDVVELRVLPEGEGNEPSEARTSSKSPYNLFSNAELAKELLQAVSEFEGRLRKLLEKSEELEPADEHKKLTRAWRSVVWELGENLLYPVYRRHKDLIPEALKNEIF